MFNTRITYIFPCKYVVKKASKKVLNYVQNSKKYEQTNRTSRNKQITEQNYNLLKIHYWYDVQIMMILSLRKTKTDRAK